MLLACAAVLAGLILLVFSADRFVVGASGLAYNLGVSPLMIGLTIVAFGTSAPELFVSAAAALQNNPNLAIGNAIGSNIANVGLVLGLTALIAPLPVQRSVLQQEIPIMFLVMVVVAVMFVNQYLGRVESLFLLGGLVLFIAHTVFAEKRQTPLIDEEIPAVDKVSPLYSVSWLLLGLVLLVVSSKILVWGAVVVAQTLGVSDLVIGLTVIAIGTSLPEVATSIASAAKGKPELAIGNVVGSNIFNLLAVVGITGVIAPTPLLPDVMSRDIPVMFAITILAVVLVTPWLRKHVLSRQGGLLLLGLYITYLAWLVYHTVSS